MSSLKTWTWGRNCPLSIFPDTAGTSEPPLPARGRHPGTSRQPRPDVPWFQTPPQRAAGPSQLFLQLLYGHHALAPRSLSWVCGRARSQGARSLAIRSVLTTTSGCRRACSSMLCPQRASCIQLRRPHPLSHLWPHQGRSSRRCTVAVLPLVTVAVTGAPEKPHWFTGHAGW